MGVGIASRPRRLIAVIMPTALITNSRAKVGYEPAVLERLGRGFDGFNRQWASREEVEQVAAYMRDRRVE